MVAGMDVGIGKVIEKLKATGEYDNTLIFFYSDNGGHTISFSPLISLGVIPIQSFQDSQY